MVKLKNEINIVDARKNDLLKEMFFEQHIRLVYKVAHKLSNIILDLDERIGFGQLGLIKAFNTFDPSLSFAWSTYAIKVITNEILYENRKAIYKRQQSVQSLDKVIVEDGKNDELCLKDIISIQEDDYNKFDFEAIFMAYNEFVNIYSEKEPRLIQIFNMYILENKTTVEIAKIFGFGQPQASRLAKKAVMAIQEIAIEMDIIDGFNRCTKKNTTEEVQRRKEKENPTKCKALYVILNYPELTSNEIGKIVNWDPMKVGRLKNSYVNGTFNLLPDNSIKEKVENYLANKKIYV